MGVVAGAGAARFAGRVEALRPLLRTVARGLRSFFGAISGDMRAFLGFVISLGGVAFCVVIGLVRGVFGGMTRVFGCLSGIVSGIFHVLGRAVLRHNGKADAANERGRKQ